MRRAIAWLLILAGSTLAQNEEQPDLSKKPLVHWIEVLKTEEKLELRPQARRALGPDGPYAKVAVAAILDACKEKQKPDLPDAADTLADHGPAAVPPLLQALKSSDSYVKVVAATALGRIRPKPINAVPALIQALRDSSAEVRGAACLALGCLGRPAHEAVPSLAKALEDKDESVRWSAAIALSGMGDKAKPALAALLLALKDKESSVRTIVADSLGKIGPDAKAAVPVLIKALGDKREEGSRSTFATALGRIGPSAKDAVPALIEAAQDEEETLRECAVRALGLIGPDAKAAVPVLIQIAKDKDNPQRDDAITALGRIGPNAKAAVPVLLEALKTREPLDFPCFVAEALGGIGPEAKAAIPALLPIVRDQRADRGLRESTAKAITKIDPVLAAKEGMETAYLTIRLGKLPAIKLGPRPAVTEEQKKRIKSLIAKLAEIKDPDFGISATLTGQAFAPLPDQARWAMGLLTDHRLKSSDALRSLVEIGPDALPCLLAALDDETPTKLKVNNFMIKLFGTELWGNPLNRRESQVLSKSQEYDDVDLGDIRGSTTVRVGDVCFVAIGQIVGRPYNAVRYQPSAIVVINSPVESKTLRERVRAIWSGPNPAKTLFESLLIDYASEGIFNGESLNGWGEGSDFQIEAAIRLLYYFPNETAPLTAARLRSLDVKTVDSSDDADMKRDVRNGVRTIDFIQGVSWCRVPAIQEALADLAKRTDDPDIKKALAGKKE
jgi:HEAT repeat protein